MTNYISSRNPNISEDRIKVIKDIISVFETGKTKNNYGIVSINDDRAGISYGKNQATDGSDGLEQIIYYYKDLKGLYASALDKYLDELQADLTTTVDPKNPPQWVKNLMSILKIAGETDPKMALAQDKFFETTYWQPTLVQIDSMKLVYPLSWAVVFDTHIHSGAGGLSKIRRLFPEVPPVSGGDEKKWTESYIRARRAWLANFPNLAVKRTVYRMDSFLSLVKSDNWNLDKTFTVLGNKFN